MMRIHAITLTLCAPICATAQPNGSSSLPERQPFTSDFFFRQLFDEESSTYSYLLADLKTGKALIIDPVLEQANRDARLVKELGFKLTYAINTHMHADHIRDSGWLRELTGCQSMIAADSGAKADLYLREGDRIEFGSHVIDVRLTKDVEEFIQIMDNPNLSYPNKIGDVSLSANRDYGVYDIPKE